MFITRRPLRCTLQFPHSKAVWYWIYKDIRQAFIGDLWFIFMLNACTRTMSFGCSVDVEEIECFMEGLCAHCTLTAFSLSFCLYHLLPFCQRLETWLIMPIGCKDTKAFSLAFICPFMHRIQITDDYLQWFFVENAKKMLAKKQFCLCSNSTLHNQLSYDWPTMHD